MAGLGAGNSWCVCGGGGGLLMEYVFRSFMEETPFEINEAWENISYIGTCSIISMLIIYLTTLL